MLFLELKFDLKLRYLPIHLFELVIFAIYLAIGFEELHTSTTHQQYRQLLPKGLNIARP